MITCRSEVLTQCLDVDLEFDTPPALGFQPIHHPNPVPIQGEFCILGRSVGPSLAQPVGVNDGKTTHDSQFLE